MLCVGGGKTAAARAVCALLSDSEGLDNNVVNQNRLMLGNVRARIEREKEGDKRFAKKTDQ